MQKDFRKFLPWRISPLAALGVFCAASIAVLFAVDSYVRYRDDIANAKATALNFAKTFATHTAMTFENVDRNMREVELLRKNHMSEVSAPASTSAALSQLQKASSVLVALGWTDSSGEVISHSYDMSPPRNNISNMSHFIAQRDDPDRGLFIAPPFRSAANGRWLTAASRRLSNADGSFAGVVTAPLNQAYFAQLYRTIDLGNGGSVLLLHRAGRILAREPEIESAIGKSFADGPLLSQYVPRSEEGTYETISVIDGAPRIAGYKVVPGLPLVLLVSYVRSDVLARWYTHLYTFGPLVGIVILTILFGTWRLTRQSEDLSEQNEALQHKSFELKQTNLRFDAALSNMSQGLCLFDATRTLVISNSRFREIYNLTEEQVKPGTPLSEILKTHENNGEKKQGSIDSHVARIPVTGAELFQLADGRVISIRRRVLSDGGWVATHEDITDQKRLETSVAEKAADLERVNLHFNAALNSMSQGLCLFDADQNVVVSNLRYAELYHLSCDQVKPGTSLRQILELRRQKGTNHAMDPELYLEVVVKKSSDIQELADGRFVAISRHQMPDGGWLTVHEDITKRRITEQERDRNREFLHRIIEHIPTQITVKDARDRRYVLLNHVAEAKLGSSGEVVGKTAYEIFSKRAADVITHDDDEALRSEDGTFLDEHEFEVSNGGEKRFITTKRVSIRDECGHPSYLINLVEDVTERKRSSDRVAYLAHHDLLTGLANRARFADKLEEAAKRCARHGVPFTVLMLDLDKFKNVNDTLGHPAGDQLLVQVAQRLKSSLRDTDVLARLGGDEFAIIQEGESNQREGAIALALRLIDIICAPFDLSGNQANVGTSIGIAFAPECGLDAESLLKKADLALYSAKSEGRNDYRLFRPEMAEASDAQKILEGELREAIRRDEFEMHYQPVVDAKTGMICSAEALVRWRHPVKGLVLPDEFIPLAESTGLIMPLGEWILQQACKDAACWPAHVKVAINVSAMQFNSPNIFDLVLCSLVESGLSPERLELEITETMLLKNEQACLLTIRQLKNLGIAIVLDDFGIGYSSSTYLTSVPFDKLKIDKSFVQGFPGRRECVAIIHSVLALGRGLDMTITAEGVETREQFEALKAAGVDLVQGYLFGRPVPLQELNLRPAESQARDVA